MLIDTPISPLSEMCTSASIHTHPRPSVPIRVHLSVSVSTHVRSRPSACICVKKPADLSVFAKYAFFQVAGGAFFEGVVHFLSGGGAGQAFHKGKISGALVGRQHG